MLSMKTSDGAIWGQWRQRADGRLRVRNWLRGLGAPSCKVTQHALPSCSIGQLAILTSNLRSDL